MRLLPGIPAAFWGSVMLWLYYPWLAACLMMIGGRIAGNAAYELTAASGCGVGALLILIDTGLFFGRRRRERNAGYTTVWSEDQQVPQVDWLTGVMMRPVGAPQPSRIERRALIRAAKQARRQPAEPDA